MRGSEMIKKMLVVADGGNLPMALVSSCIDLAQAMGSAVLGLAITKPYPLKMYGDLMVAGVEPLRRYRARNFQDANQTLAPLAAAAKRAGLEYYGMTVSEQPVDAAIVSAAEALCCDLICIS